MKHLTLCVLLLSSGLFSHHVFACSFNCVTAERSGNTLTVTGYNADGEAVYVETVSLEETLSPNITELPATENPVTAVPTGTDISTTTTSLADGGSVLTTVSTFTTIKSFVIVTSTEVYDLNGELTFVDTDTKTYERFKIEEQITERKKGII
jgi:hypothetical protein